MHDNGVSGRANSIAAGTGPSRPVSRRVLGKHEPCYERTSSHRNRQRSDDEQSRNGERDSHPGRDGIRRSRGYIGHRRRKGEQGTHDGGAGDQPEVTREVEQSGGDTRWS